MKSQLLALFVAAGAAATLNAQQFEVAGRTVQVHGFVTQGFAYSNQNNYLSMKTSEGSFAFTDGGLNLSTRLTSRLRVGGQAYARKIGELGRGRVTVDWAL